MVAREASPRKPSHQGQRQREPVGAGRALGANPANLSASWHIRSPNSPCTIIFCSVPSCKPAKDSQFRIQTPQKPPTGVTRATGQHRKEGCNSQKMELVL
ncbi:hypothetical protein J3458_012333 [Metarhizium acridum]|uniref:uncharacterized protein n=1 Tax=Metarhizium acridum TaxID=92637 RepID=UPI001C6AACD7|nr:hypothetical protein J3458_012333 [Metarhizium acridum]